MGWVGSLKYDVKVISAINDEFGVDILHLLFSILLKNAVKKSFQQIMMNLELIFYNCYFLSY